MSTERIRHLNDALRTTFQGGRVMLTCGVAALSDEDRAQIMQKVATFKDFTEDNDPYGEHDFGAFDYNGERIFWKVDYYDREVKYGSEDPSNPNVTARVLTIMRAEDY